MIHALHFNICMDLMNNVHCNFRKLLRHLLQYFWTAGNSFHRWNSDYCTKKTTRKFRNQKIMLLQGRINFKFVFLKIQPSQDSRTIHCRLF